MYEFYKCFTSFNLVLRPVGSFPKRKNMQTVSPITCKWITLPTKLHLVRAMVFPVVIWMGVGL